MAALALGEMGPSAAVAIPILEEATRDEEATVRDAARFALDLITR